MFADDCGVLRGFLRFVPALSVATALAAGEAAFQVGVAPATLQWIPGSQERVFTVARGSYVWTTMRLTGPVDSPKEDLSGRLATAAGEAIVDKVENTAKDIFKAGKDAAQGALDWLMPRPK